MRKTVVLWIKIKNETLVSVVRNALGYVFNQQIKSTDNQP